MDLTILNWIVYQWTGSALMLGLLNACRLIPIFIFSLPAGIIADRFDRQKVLMLTYVGLFLSTIGIAWLIEGRSSMTILFIAVMVRAFLTTLEVPIRNAFLANLVPEPMLASAISIQTTIINLARIIGPALAGVMLVHYMAATLLYMVSFGSLFVLVSLFLIEPNQQPAKRSVRTNEKGELKETFRYILQHPKIASVLLIAIPPMMFGFPYTTMLPVFSTELLDMGPDGFGLLLSVSSVGAIVATIFLSVGQPKHSGKLLVVSSLAFGSGISLFILYHESYILILLLMFIIGLASQFYRTLSRVVLQLDVDEPFRGRVVSIAMMDRGYIPLGALLIGWVGNVFGVFAAGLFMGLGCIIMTLCISLFRRNLWNGQE